MAYLFNRKEVCFSSLQHIIFKLVKAENHSIKNNHLDLPVAVFFSKTQICAIRSIQRMTRIDVKTYLELGIRLQLICSEMLVHKTYNTPNSHSTQLNVQLTTKQRERLDQPLPYFDNGKWRVLHSTLRLRQRFRAGWERGVK